jgi:hypothetical protein
MIGTCPSCGINLKEPPFNSRETNEVVLTLKYRDLVENKESSPSIEKAGYCKLCNASLKDLQGQNSLTEQEIPN